MVDWEVISASFRVTLHNPSLFIITLRPRCWNRTRVLPYICPRTDHDYNTSWLLSLMLLLQGAICYVSCNLTGLCFGCKCFKFENCLELPECRAAGCLFDVMPLQGQGGANGLKGWGPAAISDLSFCPSQTCCSPWYSPRLSLQLKFLRWNDWKAGSRFSGRAGRNMVCLFAGKEYTARDYVPLIGDYWGRSVQ